MPGGYLGQPALPHAISTKPRLAREKQRAGCSRRTRSVEPVILYAEDIMSSLGIYGDA